MYPRHFSEGSLIMLLDVDIDPFKQEDLVWLTELLDTVLPETGETHYYVTAFNPSHS